MHCDRERVWLIENNGKAFFFSNGRFKLVNAAAGGGVSHFYSTQVLDIFNSF